MKQTQPTSWVFYCVLSRQILFIPIGSGWALRFFLLKRRLQLANMKPYGHIVSETQFGGIKSNGEVIRFFCLKVLMTRLQLDVYRLPSKLKSFVGALGIVCATREPPN